MKDLSWLLLPLIFFTFNLSANEQSSPAQKQTKPENDFKLYYDQATYLESIKNHFKMKAEIRLQFRVSNPFDNNPKSIEAIEPADNTNFSLRRSRLKFEGHAYKTGLKYKVEYDLNNATLLDGRATLWYSEAIGLRLGRYKVNFNPERVTSSKDLQFIDRSMVNDYFTLDRQQGISLLGRLGKDTFFDTSYSFEIFNGNGRTADNTDGHFLKVAKIQWNTVGGVMEKAMSSLINRDKVSYQLGFAIATNTSPYTAFSSSGGKQLPGYPKNDKGLYEVNQWLVNINYKFTRMSLIAEYHQKEIIDKNNGETKDLNGFVINAGIFPHIFFKPFAKNLEVALRYSAVDPDESMSGDDLYETTFALNWFLNGHRNKFTIDVGDYTIEKDNDRTSEVRTRIQWDISF